MSKRNITSIKRGKIAFIVPAYNEEKVIVSSLKYLMNVASRKDIFVVDDGSKDKSAELARSQKVNVVTIKNVGKANAINTVIKIFDLTKKYDYIMPMDADTLISPNLPEVVEEIFNNDPDKKIIAVVCKVVGRDTSMTTSYRMWEYEISQVIYKSAQSIINSITVNPGCSTVYRSEIFDKLAIPARTMTEDMDLTFMIHRKKLGRIVYTPKATVITQDPKTLKEYIKQINRWYTGFWHCVVKNKVPWGGQILDAELVILGLEGVFNGLLSLMLTFLIPFVLIVNPKILFYPFIIDLLFYVLPTVLYTAISLKTAKIFVYIPTFYFLRILSGLIFLKSFLRVVVGIEEKKSFVWDTARYTQREEVSWVNQTS